MTTSSLPDNRQKEIFRKALPSVLSLLLFWWGAVFLFQQIGRLFLLPETLTHDMPGIEVLAKTLETGIRADLVVATLGILCSAILTFLLLIPFLVTWLLGRQQTIASLTCRFLNVFGAGMAVIILLFLVVDMGYYAYSHQRLDFVFVDYLLDLFDQSKEPVGLIPSATESRQAVEQTQAELGQTTKWAVRLALFLASQGLVWFGWRRFYARVVCHRIEGWVSEAPGRAVVTLCVVFITALSGLNSKGPWGIAQVNIARSEYYSLSQNPIWCTLDVLYGVLEPRFTGVTSRVSDTMSYAEAVERSRRVLDDRGNFPSEEFPFLREQSDALVPLGDGPRLNVVVLFIEGLDRRLLGRTIDLDADPASPEPFVKLPVAANAESPRQGTGRIITMSPFLDRLRNESLYFENFFSNGAQTHHGIFAALCSYYARYGRAAMKSLYTYDYLCLPSLLNKAGYHTEMVVGNNRDNKQDHMALFMARNGLVQLLDESAFPPDAERMALGVTDGALFDFLLDRMEHLQESSRPFFLTTLTLSTHHPFAVPAVHSDVKALQRFSDKYLAALRYADGELERFFDTAQRKGLLRNTVIVLLGDHGRHEGFGRNNIEAEVGHFMPPLYVWLDESVRARLGAGSRAVGVVASQVDIVPTILGLVGLQGPVSPFVGKDLSCLFFSDCVVDNFAFISRGPGGLIGFADQQGLLIHYLGDKTVVTTDLGARDQGAVRPITDPEVEERYRTLLSLFVSTNLTLENNRVWSWRKFGPTLDQWKQVTH